MANQPLAAVAKRKKSKTYYSSEEGKIKGIVINRDPPISTGWCGNDNCEHLTHKERRAAQAAADKRANR